MARRMRALDLLVPETEKAYLDLKKKDLMIAEEGFSTDVKAKKSRRSAVLLIEKIWKSDVSYVDALIPYFAMNYYDHFASRGRIPNVLENDAAKNENLFVIGCLVKAFTQRTTDFNLSQFVEKRQVRDYSEANVAHLEHLITLEYITLNFDSLTPIAFSDHFVQEFPQALLPHIPRIRCLARQLIVKSKADMEMTVYKPSIVGLSAVAAIFLKLFPGLDDTTFFADKLNDNSDKVIFHECLPKIMEWTTGLACDPVANTSNVAALLPENEGLNDDFDVGWTDLGWTEVVGGKGFGCFEALADRCNIV